VLAVIAAALAAMGSMAVAGGKLSVSYEAIAFEHLPGWAADDHAAAFAAFRQACASPAKSGPAEPRKAVADICARALRLPAQVSASAARRFFEAEFRAFRLKHAGGRGFLTGYFEPELAGSLTRSATYHTPILSRPDDLVDVVPPEERARANAEGRLSAMRRTSAGLVPYFTRAEIEAGALDGRGLELVYLADAIDAHIMHVQGSGAIRLQDGRHMRIGYAGKNGYPYSSAGSALIRDGEIGREELTLDSMRGWLRAHPARATQVMQTNRSYIFFERKPEAEGQTGPLGAQGTPLMPRRSLAVDPAYHVLGAPIFVIAPELESGFRHLMIAQDVGSAIHGPERGDIFWGTGADAEAIAGRTKHRGQFILLLPASITP
jgi:membrane-bound lytic murein transglycosylase A